MTAKNDSKLLGQVMAFIGLLFLVFAENGLGVFPVLFGTVPKLLFIAVFLILFFHPFAVPLLSLFIVGLVYDLTQANPLGYTAALLVCTHGWVLIRRRVLVKGGSLWAEFTAMMAVIMVLSVLGVMLMSGAMPALQPWLFQYGLTVALLPLAHWFYGRSIAVVALVEGIR